MRRFLRKARWGAILMVATGLAVALAQGPMAGGARPGIADRYDDMMGGYGPGGYGPGVCGPGGYGPMHGGGMMPGYGPNGMRGYGGAHGMMGGYGMMGGGMMGGTGMMQVLPSDAAPLSDDAVRAGLQRAADGLVSGAQLHDIMVFTNNVYAQVLDKDGNAVAEILLDRYSGAASPEPGPNMMWNTRFGMARGYGGYGRGYAGTCGPMGGYGPGRTGPSPMGPGMMGGYGYGPGARQAPGGAPRTQAPQAQAPRAQAPQGQAPQGQVQPRYDEAAATDLANTFLAGYLPGATVVGSQAFPGYYTFDYGTGGEPQGMLSVNAATGQVWPHTWHGAFIREMQ